MNAACFRRFFGQCPYRCIEVNIRPFHICDFASPLPCERQESEVITEREAKRRRYVPYRCEFFFCQYAVSRLFLRWRSDSGDRRNLKIAAFNRPSKKPLQN